MSHTQMSRSTNFSNTHNDIDFALFSESDLRSVLNFMSQDALTSLYASLSDDVEIFALYEMSPNELVSVVVDALKALK